MIRQSGIRPDSALEGCSSVNEDEARQALDAVRTQADAVSTLFRLTEQRRRDVILLAVEAGLSHSEIARHLGISQGRISQIIKIAR